VTELKLVQLFNLMSRFSLQDIVEATKVIDPVFLNSPQYEYGPLSEILDCRIILKVETQNPIRSFKGRGADLLVSRTDQPLMCASAGNFGQAMAYTCRKQSIPLKVVASVHANPFKIERMRALGAEVILKGEDFDAAKQFAKEEALRIGFKFVEDSGAVETVIGAGTIGLELLAYPETIDFVVVPVGNGALINGIGKAFKDSNATAKIIGVQASGAPAMFESWKEKKIITHSIVDTIADGIAVRIPVPIAVDEMHDVMDEALLINDGAILSAMKMIHRTLGLVVEPSGAVALAAVIQQLNLFKNKTVAIIVCGGNLTEEQLQNWLIK
jgi:threonine dehydratase